MAIIKTKNGSKTIKKSTIKIKTPKKIVTIGKKKAEKKKTKMNNLRKSNGNYNT